MSMWRSWCSIILSRSSSRTPSIGQGTFSRPACGPCSVGMPNITTKQTTPIVNVAQRLSIAAVRAPDQVAVVMPRGRDRNGKRQYATITFRELDRDSDRLARGLREMGVTPGTRLALLVKPSIDFVSLVFALFKAGA